MAEKLTPTPKPYERTFTDVQVAKVRAAIAENPQLARDLISSAQSGNQDDLRFIMEAGIVISEDSGKSGELIIIKNYLC